jgi:hypothetical protein
MTIQIISIYSHIQKIKNGTKCQTTRRGSKELKSKKLQQYFKPRMKKGHCVNCIHDLSICPIERRNKLVKTGCYMWTNYFGEVPITEVVYYPAGLVSMSKDDFDAWAVADGFESPAEAIAWFENQYGNEWDTMPVSVIKWDNNKRRFK